MAIRHLLLPFVYLAPATATEIFIFIPSPKASFLSIFNHFRTFDDHQHIMSNYDGTQGTQGYIFEQDPVDWEAIWESAKAGKGMKYRRPGQKSGYNDSGAGGPVIGFYVPTMKMSSTTILLPVRSQYNPKTKVLSVSHQFFFPVNNESEISDWTEEQQNEICSAVESIFQELQIDKQVSKALFDGVANTAASVHQQQTADRKDDEIIRTMNSLFKREGHQSIGIYNLRFAEGEMDSSHIVDNTAYSHEQAVKPPIRSYTLEGSRARCLPDTLANGTYGPTPTVQELVWGKADIWSPEMKSCEGRTQKDIASSSS